MLNIFSGCSSLTFVTVESGNTIYDSRDNCNAIIETVSNTLIRGCKNTTIPSSVTSISDYAFSWCRGLTSITIPNSIKSIGVGAFFNCSGLTSVTIGNSVTSIGDSAFEECRGLTSVTIPSSVTYIGDYTFYDCSGLTSIHCLRTTPPDSYFDSFSYTTYQTATLYVPSGSYRAYKRADYLKNFKNIVEE